MNYFKRYFLDVITKKYFQLEGRAPRREFWFFILFSMIISLILGAIGTALGLEYIIHMESLQMIKDLNGVEDIMMDFPVNLVQIGVSLLLMLPSFAITVRRLHDIGRSGWWQLIVLIPLIGIVVLFILSVMDSQQGENQYGKFPTN